MSQQDGTELQNYYFHKIIIPQRSIFGLSELFLQNYLIENQYSPVLNKQIN